jgi:Fur family zinc uptake transcriptional regulator
LAKIKPLAARDPIYGALRSADGPLTAYQVLDAVRAQGISAPPTVYRALNRLVEEGLAHRVESINAYVVCSHSHHDDEAAIFAICDDCGMVTEIDDEGAISKLRHIADSSNFVIQNVAIEIRGLCGECSEKQASTTLV